MSRRLAVCGICHIERSDTYDLAGGAAHMNASAITNNKP